MKKLALVIAFALLLALFATVLIWPGTLLVPEYLLVWVMNGGHP